MMEDPTEDVQEATSGKRGARSVSSYDLPTPEKLAFGERMRIAREAANLSQGDAALKMGYAQPVQLNYMEQGNRMPTLRVIMQAADLYRTTTDYLCGRVDQSEPDAVEGAQAIVAAKVAAEVRQLITAMCSASAEAVRALRPEEGEQLRLASLVLELRRAMERVRATGEFDELRGGATVLAKLDAAAELADTFVNRCARLDMREQARRLAAESLGLVNEAVARPVMDEVTMAITAGGSDQLSHLADEGGS